MSGTRISSVLAPEFWRLKCSWCLRTGNLTSTNVFYVLSNRVALSHYLGPQMAFASPNGHHCMVLRNPFQENNLIGSFSLFLKMFFYHTLRLFHKVMDTICWVSYFLCNYIPSWLSVGNKKNNMFFLLCPLRKFCLAFSQGMLRFVKENGIQCLFNIFQFLFIF